MNINFKNKNILSILIGGIVVCSSFVYVTYNHLNDPTKEQIASMDSDIAKLIEDEIQLKKDYPNSKDLGNVEDNYIRFAKEITMLSRYTPEIKNLSIGFTSIDGFLRTGIKSKMDNENIKYIECELLYELRFLKDEDTSDFLTIYKPLAYFKKVASNYAIEVTGISKTERSYKINFKILGKEKVIK